MTEGPAQAAIRHLNLLAVTDIIQIHGSPALVIDFIAGSNLRVLLAKHRLSLTDSHVDVQEEMVIPKVADFGLAKLLSNDAKDSHTKSGMIMGTPAYMAPEQFTDD